MVCFPLPCQCGILSASEHQSNTKWHHSWTSCISRKINAAPFMFHYHEIPHHSKVCSLCYKEFLWVRNRFPLFDNLWLYLFGMWILGKLWSNQCYNMTLTICNIFYIEKKKWPHFWFILLQSNVMVIILAFCDFHQITLNMLMH